MRLCDGLLSAASWLAPADLRRDWLREWRAELAWSARKRPTAVLVVRCCGAFVHALWLQWDRWRLEMLLQDLKYAWRTLARKPGFATVTVLTLAIGIGANAAIFSAVRAVLFRPLPFPDPGRLVQISSTNTRNPRVPGGAASPPDFVDWRRDSTSFEDMAAVSAGSIPWSGHGAAEQVPFAQVTEGFFGILGVPALHGRSLTADDAAEGAADVVVISHELWTRRWGSDPAAIGRVMILDGMPRRVVGIMPRGFSFPLNSELWVPLRFGPEQLEGQRGAQFLDVIARLRPAVSFGSAQAELSTIVGRMAYQYPGTNANKTVALYGLRDALVGNLRPALLALLAAVGFVLLIVCVNIASLTLTRAVGRTRELAVRSALGAGRVRLINGLLVESLLLACAGAVAGLILAAWAARVIAALDPGLGIPLLDQTRIDRAVLIFTGGIALFAALLFGTLPAWHASATRDVAQRVREEAGTLTGGRERQRLRGGLIVLETALAVVLLVGAGLLMRSFLQITSVDLGFDTSRVQTFSISLPEARYPTPSSRAAFVETLLERLAGHADVESAAAVFGLPLTRFSYGFTVSAIDGRRLTDEEQETRILQTRVVTPDFFRVMGIPILRGRRFESTDQLAGAQVAIVNEAAAALLWPGADGLGHELVIGTRMGQGGRPAGGQVVGIARDVRELGATGQIRPTLYLPHAQSPVDFVTVVLKARGGAAAVAEPARAALADLDADLPMFRVRTMDQLAANAVAQPRVYAMLIGLFAAVAVLLAAIGIYGVLTHGVAQRTREIGLRLALGARRGEVISLVVREAAALTAGGLMLGLLLAAAAARYIRSLLFGIGPDDLLTYAAVAGVLFLVALVATYIPAHRAARIDPIKALRYD
jgi:predicted permease